MLSRFTLSSRLFILLKLFSIIILFFVPREIASKVSDPVPPKRSIVIASFKMDSFVSLFINCPLERMLKIVKTHELGK